LTVRKVAAFAVPALAAAMLMLMLIPADIWHAPVNDAVYHGFDPHIDYAAGPVTLSPASADLNATSTEYSSINLATTLRRTLASSADVTVLDNAGGGYPFRMGVWSPWTHSGYFVIFGPAPDNEISVATVSGGKAERTLFGGELVSSTLGRYAIGQSYRVAFHVDRAAGKISARVSGGSVDANASLTRAESPALFGIVQFALTASSEAASGANHVTLNNYSLTLPHERSWASKVDDPFVKFIELTLVGLGIIALAVAAVVWSRRRRSTERLRWTAVPARLWIPAAAVYLLGNAVFFPLGGHPFDFTLWQLYAYIGRAYGAAQLYFLPDVVAPVSIWKGIPYVEAAFPYQAVIAYMSTGVGWFSSLLAGGAALGPGNALLGSIVKSFNVLFGLADGVLIYLILRQLNVSERWCRIGAALFLFNPAVWCSMSIWGQTHVFSIFFVLLAVLMAQRNLPLWAWLALAAAVLTRPQMFVFGLLLGAVFLRKFGWRQNLVAFSWTIIISFVAMAPLTLATSPSLPIDIFLNNVHIQQGGGNTSNLTTVSQGAYSVWPLATLFFSGVHSLERLATSSSALIVGSITYQLASQILTGLALLLVTVALLMRRRTSVESGGYLPLLAVGVTSFLMLITGVVATHFLLALPLLLLCRPWMDTTAYLYVITSWSVSTFVPMYADMGILLSPDPLSVLAHGLIPTTIIHLYEWDRFITVAIVANISAVVWLGWLALRSPVVLARTESA
jgi:hypothetical protein